MFSITPASSADIPEAASVLASAFASDAVMGSLVTGAHQQTRLEVLYRGMLRSGSLRLGRVDLARRASDGAILGVAIWEVPGQKMSPVALARELPRMLRALGTRGLIGAVRLVSAFQRSVPAEPHWHLGHLGVSRAAQGSGVGSALLTSRLDRIDAENLPAYLESSNERNRALYQRNGFVEIAAIDGILGARPRGMWRVPRAASD